MPDMLDMPDIPDIPDIEAGEDDIEDIAIFIVGGEVIVRRDAASNTPIAIKDSILIVLLNFEGISFAFTLSLLLSLLLISLPLLCTL